MSRLHGDLRVGGVGEPDPCDGVKAVLGEDEQLQIGGHPRQPLPRGHHTEELTPCLR